MDDAGGIRMTLLIEVAVGDGIVMASGSRSTWPIEGKPTRVASDFTHKLFGVGKNAVATAGYVSISGRKIASHIADFLEHESDGKTPQATPDCIIRMRRRD